MTESLQLLPVYHLGEPLHKTEGALKYARVSHFQLGSLHFLPSTLCSCSLEQTAHRPLSTPCSPIRTQPSFWWALLRCPHPTLHLGSSQSFIKSSKKVFSRSFFFFFGERRGREGRRERRERQERERIFVFGDREIKGFCVCVCVFWCIFVFLMLSSFILNIS